ncbi:MAG TPA: iron-containing alcohol dehydrogenase [Xanthobacteraceae bacterium]|nr:iron-containing alcohol dehydrogenase [Xanthobacteraceae bacterium]
MTKSGSYAYLPLERVIFGRPAADAALDETLRIGAWRVFVVASKSLARNTPVVRSIADALGGRYVGLFDGCVQHSPRASVIAAAQAVRAAAPDLILTVGGGTAIDTVKVLQICLAHGIETSEGLDGLHVSIGPDGKRLVPDIRPSPVRQVVVPTTLSGAEFSNLAGVTDERIRQKHSFIGPDIGARAVILDPDITLHTPEWLWLSTGVRGVDHAVETLCSIDAHPYCDGQALHALRLFTQALPYPDDLAARLLCQQASWLAASSIARVNYGASHGIGHALGAFADVPHGHTSCVMLPHVMRYNARATGEKQKLIADVLGRPGVPAADVIAELIASLKQPTTLRAVGVKREQLPKIAEAAMFNQWVRANPQPIRTPDDVMQILEAAW